MNEPAGMEMSPAAAEHHRRLYGVDAGADWRPERDEMALRQWPVERSRACRTARDTVLVPPGLLLGRVWGRVQVLAAPSRPAPEHHQQRWRGVCLFAGSTRATRHPLGRPGGQDLQSPFPGNTWTGRQQHDFLEPMSWLRPFVQLNLAACNAHACETGARASAGARAGARVRSYNHDPEQQSPLLSRPSQNHQEPAHRVFV
ncbi:hypothetical protein FP744_10006918 [Trichoderma asperellum]